MGVEDVVVEAAVVDGAIVTIDILEACQMTTLSKLINLGARPLVQPNGMMKRQVKLLPRTKRRRGSTPQSLLL